MSELVRQSTDERSSLPTEHSQLQSGPAARERVAVAKATQEAAIIRGYVFPAALASAVPTGDSAGAMGWKVYRDWLVKASGNPTDPIEILIIEQIALAHFRVGQLHAKTEAAESLEVVKAYSAAAVRLTGEFRRLSLALRQYRQPARTQHFTVVKQANLAENQQIAQINDGKPQNEAPSIHNDREQGSKLTHVPTSALPIESETSGSRPTQPVETGTARPRGSGEATADRFAEPTLAPVHRPENRRGGKAIGG